MTLINRLFKFWPCVLGVSQTQLLCTLTDHRRRWTWVYYNTQVVQRFNNMPILILKLNRSWAASDLRLPYHWCPLIDCSPGFGYIQPYQSGTTAGVYDRMVVLVPARWTYVYPFDASRAPTRVLYRNAKQPSLSRRNLLYITVIWDRESPIRLFLFIACWAGRSSLHFFS